MNTVNDSTRFQALCQDQVDRLDQLLTTKIPIHGRGNFPTLNVDLKSFIRVVRDKLKIGGVKIHDIKLNGGAASYVLGAGNANKDLCAKKGDVDAIGSGEAEFIYNDIDLIFAVNINGAGDFERIKQAVLKSLLDILPGEVDKSRMNTCNLKEAYVQKMIKISNVENRWSLITLVNHFGRNVEFKFIDIMKRQFEFSVDSFQIQLNKLLNFYDASKCSVSNEIPSFPSVVCESVYGDIEVALRHLHLRQIATRNPEQIRGGGLLKYCYLLVRGYKLSDDMNKNTLEKYMCSRFFIDFPDINVQQIKLHQYLVNHLSTDLSSMYTYLHKLYAIVDESTVCLMGHERRQTLQVIQLLANQVIMQLEYNAYIAQFQHVQPHVQIQNSSPPIVHSNSTNSPDVTMYNNRCILMIDQQTNFYASDCVQAPYIPAQVAL